MPCKEMAAILWITGWSVIATYLKYGLSLANKAFQGVV